MGRKETDELHGRLTALEVLMVMIASYHGADALRQAIAAVEAHPAESPAEQRELARLRERLEAVLASGRFG